MANKQPRSPGGVVSKPLVEQVTMRLNELPEKVNDVLSLKDALAELYVPITAVMGKGYRLEDVVELLAEEGIEITVPSLKYYLSRLKPKAEKVGKGNGKGVHRRSRQRDVLPEATAAEGEVTVETKDELVAAKEPIVSETLETEEAGKENEPAPKNGKERKPSMNGKTAAKHGGRSPQKTQVSRKSPGRGGRKSAGK